MVWIVIWLLFNICGETAPSTFEPLMDGVYVVRDDSGQWGANMSLDITHQVRAEYQAKKILDLSNVPQDVWANTKQVRLSVHFGLRDYSWHDAPQENGLDEHFEIVVNGKVHTYPTNCGAPAWIGGRRPVFGWYDFILPKEQFTKGVNEIILRKAQAEKNDDYLYLCIDLNVPPGNSYVTFDGKEWRQDILTVPGGKGEYMVRLLLITQDLGFTAIWQPGLQDRLDDPAGVILYRGSREGKAGLGGLELKPGQSARMEWSEDALDVLSPTSVLVEGAGPVRYAWLDAAGKPTEAVSAQCPCSAELPAGRALRPSGFVVSAGDQPAAITKITLRAVRACHPPKPRVDIAPAMAPPAGKPKAAKASVAVAGKDVVFQNAGLRARFSTAGEKLRLLSLYNAWTDSEMIRWPEEVALFLVEIGGKRYAGSREFRLQRVHTAKQTLIAELALEEPALTATLKIGVDGQGLRMGLALANAGQTPVDLKVAFPHLAGLAVSDVPADDYYFFPWGGGIFSNRPAIIRRGYGDHEALYQLMDVYSPQRGGGLAIRADDAEGWHKVLALRKHVPGQAEFNGQVLSTPAAKDYQWANPFEPVEGISLAYEYLRRTRDPKGTFAPADCVLWAHPGDWKSPMATYTAWAHRVWKFRPYPSRLKGVVNMIATGWGHDFLFRDGAYRTDFIRPDTNCIELMSWWDWSPLGPWGTPIDKVKEVLGEGAWKLWEPYFVKDPVTGQMMWNNQPGDYDGYNERFGGLPAFRKAIETYKSMGALVTLYTDPFRLDASSKTGRAHGEEWGVMNENGEYSKAYDVYNPCHDNPDVRQWVADTMERVMRETGADGIRLDEYGHRGFVCYSNRHTHTYAERGITQWQKATAEATRMVRERMDRVNPASVLTTEHPGYDYLTQFIDGCITYDLTVQKTELRPLEVNLQRFYFPECKAYELDHQGADPQHKKRFWNGVASFGSYYPQPMYQVLREYQDVFEGRDCEPLVPTLAKYIYANRFGSGQRIIYTVYNATGHTYDGPVLAIKRKANQEVMDLLTGAPCHLIPHGEGQAVHLYLERDEVACIGILAR